MVWYIFPGKLRRTGNHGIGKGGLAVFAVILLKGGRGVFFPGTYSDGSDELRILTRDHRIEVYLNNQWMFGITMADAFGGSGVGTMVVNGQARFTNLRITEIEPLIPTDP